MRFLWSHRKAHTSWGKTGHPNSKGNIISRFLQRWHAHAHTMPSPLLHRAPVPWESHWALPGSRSQSWLAEPRLPQHYTGCRTAMNWSGLDFPLSFSARRLCTNLYLSSHHTSAWEWLAFPQGHSIWSPCFTHTNTHAFIILLLYFPPRLAVHPVPVTRQKVLQSECTIQTGSNAKSSH